MLVVPSLGGRALALAASAAAHATILAAVVSGGHAPAGESASRAESGEIAILVEAPAPAPVSPPIASEERAVGAAAHGHPHAHTHPYPVAEDHDAHPHDASIVHAPVALRPMPAAANAADVVPADAAANLEAAHEGASAREDAAPARFTMTSSAGAGAFGAVGSRAEGGGEVPIVNASSLVEPARRVAWTDPAYPEAARAAGVEAEVPVELVVDERGAVTSARVLRRAGYGLDEAALEAVRRWRFAPRTVGGRPVRVRMPWAVRFTLTD